MMSVTKIISQIEPSSKSDEGSDSNQIFAIISDPKVQFACAFLALIHDIDHQGVSNAQLVKEEASIAIKYKNCSVAEQNSFDLAWEVLMRDDYASLRSLLFPTVAELNRFRQIVVNCIIATDIMDGELKSMREERWKKAFDSEESHFEEDERDSVNRKATIILEHIIQASDVSHTMQHWHIYRKVSFVELNRSGISW